MTAQRPPNVALETPAVTGAMLVMFQPGCDGGGSCDMIEQVLGRRPPRTADYLQRLVDFTTDFRSGGMGYFDDFGLAILDPAVGGMDPSTLDALRGRDEVLIVRPEYRVHAMGWLARLFGFGQEAPKTAVNEAAGRRGAGTANEAAARRGSAPVTAAEGATWGVGAVGADVAGYDGSGIKVAILDTGFDFDHPDFVGREIVSESFVIGETAQDGAGHGAHVAGTAVGPAAPAGAARYGVAPGAQLHVAKVLGNDGSGREGDMLAGILWALEQGCEIINMSLGRRPLPGDSTNDYDRIGQLALDRGALIIAAAGNESARGSGYVAPVGAPANARSIMAVGAVDEALAIADFSNGGLIEDGGAVDICAPGVDVLSSVPGPSRYASFSGTSMAAPHVAGVAALLAQSDATLRGQALWDALTGRARDIGLPARDGGAGLAQAPAPLTS